MKILLGALGLSILVIVGLGSYIVGQNKSIFESFRSFKATESPSPTPQPEPSQTPIPTEAPVATSAPTSQGTGKITPTPSPQSTTSSPSPSPTQVPTPTPTPTPAPAIFPKLKLPLKMVFKVTGVTVDVSPTEYTGPCPKHYAFTAAITVNAAGTVTYKWVNSAGEESKFTQNMTFDGAGTKIATDSWIKFGLPGDSYSGWQKVQILTPNTLDSNLAKISLNCKK